MSSSNNSNRKDDGSIITVDEFKSKVNQGKCFAGLAFSALLKADQELKENGEKLFEALTRAFPQVLWTKESLTRAYEEYEMTWTEQKLKWERSQKKMKKEQEEILESK